MRSRRCTGRSGAEAHLLDCGNGFSWATAWPVSHRWHGRGWSRSRPSPRGSSSSMSRARAILLTDLPYSIDVAFNEQPGKYPMAFEIKEFCFPAPAGGGRRLRSTACNKRTIPLVPLASLVLPNRDRRVAFGSSTGSPRLPLAK